MRRDELFISHATPEDNKFAAWLASQLMLHGYKVWCDIIRLKGGQISWQVIDAKIKEAGKFLLVISSKSRHKEGVLNEVETALAVEKKSSSLHNFVIPLIIDGLPYDEMPIQVRRRQAIRFNDGWASGLRSLLRTLAEEDFPRLEAPNTAAIASWWASYAGTCDAIVAKEEVYTSNWFSAQLPQVMYVHRFDRLNTDRNLSHRLEETRTRGFLHQDYLLSFCSAASLKASLGDTVTIVESRLVRPADFLKQGARGLPPTVARNAVVNLMKQAWDRWPKVSSLHAYELANGNKAYYFTEDDVGTGRVRIPGNRGTGRRLIGQWHTKTMRGERRIHYWHFAVEVKPCVAPFIGFIFKPHVVFSDDGVTVWDSKDRMHKARRRRCRHWWNPEWRDRILASLAWFSDCQDVIRIPVSEDSFIEVSTRPIQFRSQVSYRDPHGKPLVEIMGEDDEENDI
ncbi:MAG: toll/interleukin-1 receptor domain-containing protein [Candidatus Fermentithermobacillus carboniphilus]|uniref:Toll/interleukin-1 receptor domain-containing protein n=1 Tax=Candidatus Fermentithermobacillus carboniphilus TaxID=3085328 RepID=A0AAT9LE45_9FIRM|nr:MAG: toll/interleukin-1 receptor domain-containing protein [Candidatus Fermentithermobacillus carboniphilus]